MNRFIKVPVVLGALLCTAPVMGEEGLKTFGVQASDFSDKAVTARKGESCADFLKFLQEDEKYTLIGTAGVVGPPGVVYTLRNNKGEIAIIKCGSAGCGHEGEDGH